VKSFYRNFDIDLPNTGKNNSTIPLEHHKFIPDRETIREILELATLRNKAIIFCGCSAGLSVNEIVNLKVGQFRKGYDPDTGIPTLHMRRQKVQYDYITFLSPEATKATQRYLDWRNNDHVESNGPRRERTSEGRRVYSDDDYLFISDYSKENFLETHDDALRKLGIHAIVTVYRRLGGEVGGSGKWRDIRSHNMRKYFNTTLLNAGADIFFVDFLMGHKISGTHDAYYRADSEALKKKYIKYLPFLAIEDTEVHTIESEEYRMLREENEQMKQEFEQLKSSMRQEFAQMVDAKVDARIKRGMSGIED
jgi:integrase